MPGGAGIGESFGWKGEKGGQSGSVNGYYKIKPIR
jgi:hypothetical protein